MLAEHMGRVQEESAPAQFHFETQYRAHMAKLGKKGGKASGASRMTNLTTEQRQAIALKAARAMGQSREETLTDGLQRFVRDV